MPFKLESFQLFVNPSRNIRPGSVITRARGPDDCDFSMCYLYRNGILVYRFVMLCQYFNVFVYPMGLSRQVISFYSGSGLHHEVVGSRSFRVRTAGPVDSDRDYTP